MKEIANHILYRAREIESPITNLQLQKVLYFTIGYMIREEIFVDYARKQFNDSKMEAWLYGPVVPELYEKFKEYKSTPIQDEGEKSPDLNKEKMNNMIDKLIKINPFTLVDMSHTHSHWEKNEEKIKNGLKPEYNFEDLEETFHA